MKYRNKKAGWKLSILFLIFAIVIAPAVCMAQGETVSSAGAGAAGTGGAATIGTLGALGMFAASIALLFIVHSALEDTSTTSLH